VDFRFAILDLEDSDMINRFRTAIQRYRSGNPNFANQHPNWLGIFALVALTLCGARAEAQHPAKAVRIGYLDSSTAAGSAELLDEFRKQMTQLNWIEGKNLTIAYRYAEGKGAARLAELATELVGLTVDVIVASATSTALAAKKATSTIPIVMTSSVDPVGIGLIASLARPGGNITGLAGFSDDLAGKRLEILRRCSLNPQASELSPARVVEEANPN
jgi:ABC-type uncharacterized transport system substrate-binding protein